MLIKTSELIGPALDYAVAKCEGIQTLYETRLSDDVKKLYVADASGTYRTSEYFEPSTNWAQSGPFIEREEIDLNCYESPKTGIGWWSAEITGTNARAKAISPLIAAMRCYIASKLGDTVEIPNELSLSNPSTV